MQSRLRIYFIRFCILCSLYHIFTVFDDYFRREVNEYISMKISKDTEVPTLSVCFEIIYFPEFFNYVHDTYNISFVSKSLIYPHFYKPLDGKLTLRKLFQLLPKNESIFNFIHIASKSSNESWITPEIQAKPYFFEPFYCFAIGVTSEEPYRISWNDISVADYGGTILRISLNTNMLKNHTTMFLFTHPHNTLVHEATLGVQRVPLTKVTTTCEFSFEKVRYKLLPYPYKTDCLEYRNIGFQTRSQAIDRCVQAMVKQKFDRNLPFSSASVDSDAYLGYGLLFKMRTNITKLNILRNIKKSCARQYSKPDCDFTYFKMSNCWIFDAVADNLSLKMKVINRPYIEVVSRETVSLSQSIIYFASILGLWFGFSIAFDVPKALKFTKRQLCKKKTKLKNSNQGALSFFEPNAFQAAENGRLRTYPNYTIPSYLQDKLFHSRNFARY